MNQFLQKIKEIVMINPLLSGFIIGIIFAHYGYHHDVFVVASNVWIDVSKYFGF